eukprot:m.68881 g.68881  ORF g.68881 m.68881 type:complete len:684 (-) comp24013_c0_seq1:62-2113(-)
MPGRKRWFVCCTSAESKSDTDAFRRSSSSNDANYGVNSKTSPYDDVMYEDYEEKVSYQSDDVFEQDYGLSKTTLDDGYGFVESLNDVESNNRSSITKAPTNTSWFSKKKNSQDFDPSGRGTKSSSSRRKQQGGKSKAILRADLRKGKHSKKESQSSPRTKRRAQKAVSTEHEPAPPGSVVCVRGHLVVFEEHLVLKQKRTCDRCSDKFPKYKCQGRCDFHMCAACYEVSQKRGGGISATHIGSIQIAKKTDDTKHWSERVCLDEHPLVLEKPSPMHSLVGNQVFNWSLSGLPICPLAGITQVTVQAVENNLKNLFTNSPSREEETRWTDGATLNYLLFSVMLSKFDSRFKKIALKLMSKIEIGVGLNSNNQRIHGGGRSPNEVLSMIKKVAQDMSDRLLNPLLQYRETNHLPQILKVIDVPPRDRYTQAMMCPWMATQYRSLVKGKIDYEIGITNMLLIVAHLAQPHFVKQTAGLGGECGKARHVAVKSRQRLYNKNSFDYKDAESPKAANNLDLNRKSITSDNAADQLEVWKDLVSRFEVVRVKNTFMGEGIENNGLQQVLINVVLELQNETTGQPLTYGDLASPQHRASLNEAVNELKSAEPDQGHVTLRNFDTACELLMSISAMPEIASEPIKLIAEIQLYLQFYLDARKETHLYFKILRAQYLSRLKADCSQHMSATIL